MALDWMVIGDNNPTQTAFLRLPGWEWAEGGMNAARIKIEQAQEALGESHPGGGITLAGVYPLGDDEEGDLGLDVIVEDTLYLRGLDAYFAVNDAVRRVGEVLGIEYVNHHK